MLGWRSIQIAEGGSFSRFAALMLCIRARLKSGSHRTNKNPGFSPWAFSAQNFASNKVFRAVRNAVLARTLLNSIRPCNASPYFEIPLASCEAPAENFSNSSINSLISRGFEM